jgi:hypothetical protein
MRCSSAFVCVVLVGCGGPSSGRDLFEESLDASVPDASASADAPGVDDAETTPSADVDPSDAPTEEAGCAAPRKVCGGACVDLQTDASHCGACGNACTELGLSCVAGACKCTGATCSGRCVSTATDPLHCGACGASVCENEVCVGGKRACAPGFTACGGISLAGCLGCKPLMVDGSNCGTCGRSCATGTCLKGACVDASTCPAPLTRCTSFIFGGGCTDLSRDPSNCGACDKQCKAGELCAKGKCTPYAGAVGCTTCPCAGCKGALPQCCLYGKTPVCSTACP